MSILATIGWFLLGAVAVGALATFWDDIRVWLNNTAADAVERALGYGARERMYRATCKIDKVVNMIRNQTVVLTKKNELDTMYDKVTMEVKMNTYEIDSKVLQEIANRGSLVETLEYRH